MPVYDRYLLAVGQELHGPAIVEERETTVGIPVGSSPSSTGSATSSSNFPSRS